MVRKANYIFRISKTGASTHAAAQHSGEDRHVNTSQPEPSLQNAAAHLCASTTAQHSGEDRHVNTAVIAVVCHDTLNSCPSSFVCLLALSDNRVPTPASVTETHSQQALPPDYPAAELKTEHQEDEQDFESGKKQPDLKMEDEDVKPPQVKEQPESVEAKQEQMEMEEKKPETKTEPKEEEMPSTNSTAPSAFPTEPKHFLHFEEIDGVDVCFFGMHVQEYGSDCPFPYHQVSCKY
ncbi:histone lysine acetyltransferase CREBBP-like [Cyprinus carpio]|uniref:histone acetyltransferase n=1 Tax=Cyprinus carpio TaxID=7962 RepID=A0A9Q9WSL4_CYPCA|nr:histone lysine acetyltransferase CREBBP-like [Cyprinus carpio]